jgi:hypothetical protein
MGHVKNTKKRTTFAPVTSVSLRHDGLRVMVPARRHRQYGRDAEGRPDSWKVEAVRSPMPSRSSIAVSICGLSALVLGYFCLFQHLSPANTFSDMFIIWWGVADWLSGRWRLMFQTPKGVGK